MHDRFSHSMIVTAIAAAGSAVTSISITPTSAQAPAATSALGQALAPLAGPTSGGAASTASVPDFSGIWTRFSYEFDRPLSGPGPVMRRPPTDRIVGDYTNPILKPEAAESVKKHGEIELGNGVAANPRNQCWPEGVPFVFGNIGMQMLQQPDKITVFYEHDHQVRRVRMNQPHPAHVTPSWYGDSVGHYEGATLVIDTVGIKTDRPFAMVDVYGTPYTEALHVVERYRLIEYEAAIKAEERSAKEHLRVPFRVTGPVGLAPAVDHKGKGLQLQFMVEDEGVFTMPWSATVTYLRAFGEWAELICVENPHELLRKAAVPSADKPDF
jgi:hypothetical protein